MTDILDALDKHLGDLQVQPGTTRITEETLKRAIAEIKRLRASQARIAAIALQGMADSLAGE